MRRVACLVILLAGAAVAAAQPVPPRQRPDRPWTVSVVTGVPSQAPLQDVERVMTEAGYDGIEVFCLFGSCPRYPRSMHPRAFRDTWAATINRRIGPRLGVSVTGGRTLLGWTTGLGRVSDAYLEVETAVSHVVPAATFTPAPGLRLSAGAGLFTTTFTGLDSGPSQTRLRTSRRPGLLGELSLTVPRRTRAFFEVSAQERWLARQPLGPFDVLPDGAAVFPTSSVRVSNWFIGVGFGLRF